jgi:O-antigen/teichoic acid export membrane protein
MALLAVSWGWLYPMDFFVVRLDAALGIAIGAWVLIGWAGEALRGVGRVGVYALLQPGWWMLLAGGMILLLGWDPIPALSATAVVLALLGMAAAWVFFRKAVNVQDVPAEDAAIERTADIQKLRALAGPIWLGSMLHLVLSWADTALIAAWLSEADVAHYRAAFRLAALLTFTQFAVNALGAPTFSALHDSGDREGLRRAVQRIGWMNTAVAFPGALFLGLLGPWLLGFWGPEFAGDTVFKALLVLAAGQCFNALCGPVMYLLNMTGGERAGLAILAVSAVVQLGTALVFVPSMGILGAAISAAVGMFCWNGLGVWYIWRHHGFLMVSLLSRWWKS